MKETLGRCECIFPLNKRVVLDALGKEDARLLSEMDRLNQNKEKLGDEFVETSIKLLLKQREYFSKVTKIVVNTPICKTNI